MLSQWGNTGGSSVGGFSNATFVLGAQSTLIPTSSAGSSTPTFTRATTATVVDFEGRLVTVPSGAARFQGARFVQNLLGSSNYYGTGVSDPFGGTSATTLTGALVSFTSVTVVVGRSYLNTVYLRRRSGSGVVIVRTPSNTNINVTASLTTSWQRFSSGATTAIVTTNFHVVELQGVGDQVDVAFAMMEDVTGQSNTNPSEFVSVGVAAAPYFGAGIDGVKYFTTQNGNTVASNVVTEATGAVIADATLKGYLSEGAGTQILATADIRDMTTANWTLGATMTRARTSTGIDGASNTATRLTGGAVAATNIITTTITAAATSRTYSAYVKRVTGTGIVRISQDNFATNTDITSQLVNGSWVLIQLNQSQLNAVMGFKIDTSTDAIDVDCNQFESGAFATSRMLATGAARNADVLTFASAGNISGTVGTFYAEFTSAENGTANERTVLGNGNNGGFMYIRNAAGTALSTYDGAARVGSGLLTNAPIVTPDKAAISYSGSAINLALNGTLGTPQTFDGDYNLVADWTVGDASVGNRTLYGTIRNIRIFNRALSAAQLAAMTT